MRKKLFREILPGENKEEYLEEIKEICRISKDKEGKYRREYGNGRNYFTVLVWNTHNPNNRIEKGDGFDAHHMDEDPMNDDISNIIKELHGIHIRGHMKGDNHPMFGKHHLPETIEKLSALNKGNKNPNAKKVMAADIEYPSIKEAAGALSVHTCTIWKRIKRRKPGYYYIQEKRS